MRNDSQLIKRWLLTISGAALLFFYSSISASQEPQSCESQEECGDNAICVGVEQECTEWVDPDDFPDVDAATLNEDYTCTVIKPGFCRSTIECETDEDCGENAICRKADIVGSSPDGPITLMSTARCEPQAYSCTSDDDCPNPLTCIADQCHWEQIACTDDSDCNGDFICTLYSAIDLPVDDNCLDTRTCDEAELFKTREEHICFPKLVVCEADRDCAEGSFCSEFATLDEFEDQARMGIPYGPLQWRNPEHSAIVACLPEGLIAVYNGHGQMVEEGADGDWFSRVDGGITAGGGSSQGPTNDNSPPKQEYVGTDGGVSDAGVEEESDSQKGGCSVASFYPSSAGGYALFSLLLSVLAIRRRRI